METTQNTFDFESPASPTYRVLSNLCDDIVPTEVFTAYWEFAHERQQVLLKRIRGENPPWTSDPILRNHRFTNVFRASDRVSQYLIKNVIYEGDQSPQEVFFRTILFKLFNKIDTWKRLQQAIGDMSWRTYRFEAYDNALDRLMKNGVTIYSAAYVMPTAQPAFGLPKKHSNHLKLIERMMADDLPAKISRARSLQGVYESILSYPSMGPFLAFQYAIDLNYGPLIDFDENEFVIAGPGAKDGIQKCFISIGGHTYEDIIRMVTEKQEEYFAEVGLPPVTLWGRKLHLIDCQNLFCEIGKYAREKFPHRTAKSNRTRIKQKFTQNLAPVQLWFPPKWGINQFIGGQP
jgi:hypothetical protein